MRHIPSLLNVILRLSRAAGDTSAPTAGQPTLLFGGGPSTATPPGLVNPPVEQTNPPEAQTPGSISSGAEFGVAAVVDTTTDQVSREQAQAAIDQASKFLRAF